MAGERDYVLGTHDEEIVRLALQHRVWRPRALDAWRRAGFTVGGTILDVGCGPGHASIDLAEIVGPGGRVIAIDRSRRFLDHLERTSAALGLRQIEVVEADLDEGHLPPEGANGAWCRWVLAFVRDPRALLAAIAGALRPGGSIVLHEYFDYRTWRLAPRTPEIEEFVRVVMESWRASGGEPDIGLEIPRWLADLGFEIRSLTPIVDIVPPSSYIWEWPRSFVEVGLRRLVHLGRLDPEREAAIAAAMAAREAEPGTLMITPSVIEIIAARR
jgi:SAM-dependent methyltransferase